MNLCLRRVPAALLVFVLCTALQLALQSASARAAIMWPVPGPLIREFDPPDPDWLPGHRGIDLAATSGEPIVTPRAGVVEFAGKVAGTPVVVVTHGVVRATYLPARARVAVGQAVAAGDAVAVVVPGSHCEQPCVHWGARANGRYVDPRLLLGEYRVVLTPVAD